MIGPLMLATFRAVRAFVRSICEIDLELIAISAYPSLMTIGSKIAARGAFLSILLSGCAFGPRKPFSPVAPQANAAAIYFYRPSEMTARLIRPTITANGVKVGRLANDSYGVAHLPAGEVQLRSAWPGITGAIRDDTATVNVEAGKNYYLRVRYHVGKPRNVTPRVLEVGALSFEDRTGLEEVPEADAVPQLAGLEPCDSFEPAHAPSASASK